MESSSISKPASPSAKGQFSSISIMKIKKEPIEHETLNVESIEECSEYDLKEMDIKLEVVHHSHSKIRKRKPRGDKPYQCEKCGKAFSTKPNLENHLVSHTGEKSFECNDCGKAFTRASILKAHKRIHTGERPYKCDECDETFRTSDSLVQHKGKHKGVADYLCDMCAKTYFDPISLRMHRNFHKNYGSKIETCPECGKMFKQKRNLVYHQTVYHQGLKPKIGEKFICKECRKPFRSNAELQVHMRVHTGEKPHVCTFCQKAFSKSCNLKVHTRIHTRETPFKCKECDKGFRELFPLKKHMLKIHGIDYKPQTPNSRERHVC